MTTVQKIIKYLAMAFAIFLCVNIIGGILAGLAAVSFIFSDHDNEPLGEMQEYTVDGEISSLSLELSGAELKIETSDAFSVESNHPYISVSTKDGRLRIYETKKPFSFLPKGVTVILNIPKDVVFDDATIETGAGAVEIDALSSVALELSLGAGEVEIGALSTDVLKLSLGAGQVTIDHATANSRADIDGGAGELTIRGGLLRALDLDMGVGQLTLKSRIEGQSRIDCGIGETSLTLIGSREDYQIDIDKGIGDALLEGESMQDDCVYGSGENRIEIDGGIGAINITFSN